MKIQHLCNRDSVCGTYFSELDLSLFRRCMSPRPTASKTTFSLPALTMRPLTLRLSSKMSKMSGSASRAPLWFSRNVKLMFSSSFLAYDKRQFYIIITTLTILYSHSTTSFRSIMIFYEEHSIKKRNSYRTLVLQHLVSLISLGYRYQLSWQTNPLGFARVLLVL